uniref:IS1595 family transposase n=1 Tax=Massilia sp. HP4 TaxID=2562316 RepID=UPI0010C12233
GALLDSRTVRSAARQVGVHRNTTFRWRHRFLHWVKYDRPRQLTGIVEADETFLLESQKGSRKLDRKPRKRGGKAALRGLSHHLDCILVARDRSGQTIDAVTGSGALTKSQLKEYLLPKLDPQALLVTDANAAYRAFAREHGIAHRAVNLQAGQRVRASTQGAIHVQNVNAYHRRFKEWLARFHGVASWRLPNYLGWLWALDGGRVASVEQLLRITIRFIHR